MAELIQAIFSGLTIGSIYALVALGFSFIYASTRVVNFAQGDWAMVAGMCAASLAATQWGVAGAAVLAPVVGGAIGFVVFRLFVGYSRSVDLVTISLIFLGTSLILQGIVLEAFGPEPLGISDLGGQAPLNFAGAAISQISVITLGVTFVLLLLVSATLTLTRQGRATVASADNPEVAALCGIDVKQVTLLAFVLSGMLAGVAGFLVTPVTSMSYQGGLSLTLQAFAASAIGGLRGPAKGVAGGLVLGLIDGLAATYVGGGGGWGELIATAAALAVLVIVAPHAAKAGNTRPEDATEQNIGVSTELARL